MIVGPVHFSLALPFFILLGALVAVMLWHACSKKRRLFAPHTHAQLHPKKELRSLRRVQIALYFLMLIVLSILFFGSLNPRLVTRSYESFQARRICIVMDLSGSMTIGFGPQSSPLPSYEKTRIAQAGNFIRKLVEKRRGDYFCLIFFDNEQYVARDFTQDTNQITEVLAPANLIGAFNPNAIPEALRLREDSEHKGTWAAQGLEFAKDFVTLHADFTGEEIIIYVGDAERQSGGLDTSVAKKLASIKNEYGIRGYAVIIAGDYMTSQTPQSLFETEQAKSRTFEASGIPVYVIEHPQSAEKITRDINRDIPLSKARKNIITKKSLAPWALTAAFFVLWLMTCIDRKFPRIP